MSARKSEFGSPVHHGTATPPPIRFQPSGCDVWMTDQIGVLLDAASVRSHVKKLAVDLREFQANNGRAFWPTRKENPGLYWRLYRARTDYKKALAGDAPNPFTIDDLRLLSRIGGSGGPRDQALGDGALGKVEQKHGLWRWTFQGIGSSIFGDWCDADAAATAELATVQSLLFPPLLPTEEWFDPTRRAAHLRRVKISAQKRQSLATSAAEQQEPQLSARLAYPHDARTLQNDFPGFFNLGNTCYLNSVLRCIFHCEPLASDLFSPARSSGIIEAKLRELFADHIASGPIRDGRAWAPRD